jgi:hypothetical protein
VRLGAENRKEVMVMAVLLAIAIPLVLYAFKDALWGSNAAASPSVPSAAPQLKAPGAMPVQDSSQDPRLRLDILEASRNVKYEAGGRNIFRKQEPKIEPTITPVRQAFIGPLAPTPTPPPPPPPPMPLNYYGFASKPGEPRKVFLQEKGGEQQFIVGQGDIVARRYKVIQIQTNSVLMEDVLNNNRESIPLTAR